MPSETNRSVRSHPTHAALRDTPYGGLSGVVCDVRAGHATLVGEVPSYFLKQVAQEIVRKINGVDGVTNRLVVTARCRRVTRWERP